MGKYFIVVIIIILFLPTAVALNYAKKKHSLKFTKTTEWSIGLYQGKTPLCMSEIPTVQNPVLTAGDVTDVDAMFVADPFVFVRDSIYYLFFEVLNRKSGQGDIGYAISKNGLEWKYGKIVLDESFHISYPFVFTLNNEIYMIPESAEAGELRLYKASEFPAKWTYVKTLIKGAFGDHSLFQDKGTWWIFAGSDANRNNSLKLYYADSLMGTWTEHPMSPIVKNDANKARPGGRIVSYLNKNYRLAQDCDPTYGASLNLYEIKKINREVYSEKKYHFNPLLKANGNSWSRHGMHQIDYWKVHDSLWMGIVDGYKKDFLITVGY